jgi:hypothetical protein
MLTVEVCNVLNNLQRLFENYTLSYKEAQIEKDFIEPVRRLLG